MLKFTRPPKEDMILFYTTHSRLVMKNKPYSKTTTMKGDNYKVQFSILKSWTFLDLKMQKSTQKSNFFFF